MTREVPPSPSRDVPPSRDEPPSRDVPRSPELARALGRLLHKYRTLGELRRARARGEPIPERSVFRTLASEFPGVLYELDRLPIEDIDARTQELTAALAAPPEVPVALWMRAMADYHALYRAALFAKLRFTKGLKNKPQLPTLEEAATLARAASRLTGVEVTPAFVQAALQPRAGRIGPVVLAEVAARAGATEEDVRTAMFPTRKDFSSHPR